MNNYNLTLNLSFFIETVDAIYYPLTQRRLHCISLNFTNSRLEYFFETNTYTVYSEEALMELRPQWNRVDINAPVVRSRWNHRYGDHKQQRPSPSTADVDCSAPRRQQGRPRGSRRGITMVVQSSSFNGDGLRPHSHQETPVISAVDQRTQCNRRITVQLIDYFVLEVDAFIKFLPRDFTKSTVFTLCEFSIEIVTHCHCLTW